jgi:type II secretory pathway pseudopilin PulG
MNMNHLRSERGFTLMELLVSSVVTMIVLGSAVALTSQIQNGYRRQLEDSAGEQEARYALEWINRYLRGAGNNPLLATKSDCPGADTDFVGVIIDPNGDGENDDITLQADSNPPDGKIGGESPACDQRDEHVTISFCSQQDFDDDLCAGPNTIEFLDNAVGENATTRTDAVIDDLQFVYRDAAGAVTANQANVFYVEVQIGIRTRTINPATGEPETRTLSATTRVRDR